MLSLTIEITDAASYLFISVGKQERRGREKKTILSENFSDNLTPPCMYRVFLERRGRMKEIENGDGE